MDGWLRPLSPSGFAGGAGGRRTSGTPVVPNAVFCRPDRVSRSPRPPGGKGGGREAGRRPWTAPGRAPGGERRQAEGARSSPGGREVVQGAARRPSGGRERPPGGRQEAHGGAPPRPPPLAMAPQEAHPGGRARGWTGGTPGRRRTLLCGDLRPSGGILCPPPPLGCPEGGGAYLHHAIGRALRGGGLRARSPRKCWGSALHFRRPSSGGWGAVLHRADGVPEMASAVFTPPLPDSLPPCPSPAPRGGRRDLTRRGANCGNRTLLLARAPICKGRPVPAGTP
jgi:hypothetical protein